MSTVKFNFAKAIEEVAKSSKLEAKEIEEALTSNKIRFGKSLKWYPADKADTIPEALTLSPVSLHERSLDNGDVYFTLKCKADNGDLFSVPAAWIFSVKGQKVENLQFSNLVVSDPEIQEWSDGKKMVQAKYDLA